MILVKTGNEIRRLPDLTSELLSGLRKDAKTRQVCILGMSVGDYLEQHKNDLETSLLETTIDALSQLQPDLPRSIAMINDIKTILNSRKVNGAAGG